MISNAKRCSKCKEIKAFGEFSRSKKNSDGFQSWCKSCKNKINYSPSKNLLSKYRLTQVAFNAKLASQGNACGLCREEKPEDYKWHVDHDHNCCPGIKTCGKCVRAILCFVCNSGLGKFKDDPALLRMAADYIEKYRKEDDGTDPSIH